MRGAGKEGLRAVNERGVEGGPPRRAFEPSVRSPMAKVPTTAQTKAATESSVQLWKRRMTQLCASPGSPKGPILPTKPLMCISVPEPGRQK